MSLYDTGDVIVTNDEIMLYSFNRSNKLNIFNLIRSFDIFESLSNFTVSADFYIAEGVELFNNFPLAGEEWIELEIQTPSRKKIKYEFFIESMTDMKSNEFGGLKSYVLRGVTRDFLNNSFRVHSKRYKDKKYDAAIAEVITTDLKSEVSIATLESTDGKFDYVVNNVRPFQTIDLICERAVSAEGNKSSLFFFYQDNEGYHFTTLEKLIKERKPAADQLVFSYDSAARAERYDKLVNIRNILSYETFSQGSSVDKIKRGNMKTQIREFNILTGEYYKKEEYSNPSDHKVYEATDSKEDHNSSSYNSYVTEMPAVTRMTVKDGLRPDMKHNENIHWKRPFSEKLSQAGLRIRVYGDTEIRVGDVIKLDIPEISGTDSPKIQEYYSGKYIITEMKHRLDKRGSAAFEHYMIFELRKPNMLKAIP